jgi:N-acetylglucosamine-6-sulfatase
LQGQHDISGDEYLPYEESIRVPFILRGPGVPAGETVRGQVTNVDFAAAGAPAGRTQDGVSLLPTARDPRRRPRRTLEIEATAPLFEGDIPNNRWDQPYTGVRTDRYTYVVYTKTGEEQLFDRQADPYELNNVAGDPDFAAIKAGLAARLAKLGTCKGSACSAVRG